MMQFSPANRRSLFISFFVVVAVIAGYFVIVAIRKGRDGDSPSEKAIEPAPISVRVAQAQRRRLTPVIEVIGTVLPDPERYSILAAATNGIVEKLVVREGTRVAKNELVIQLDERPARLALDRAEAAYARLTAKPLPEELSQARNLVEKTRAAHELAESRLKRGQELQARNRELVPEIELMDEKRNEQATRAEWETAQAQLQLLEQGPREEIRRESRVEVEAAKLQLEYCQVRSPIAGEVVELKALVGERADVGTPLITILDTSEVLVQARIPGNRLQGVVSALQGPNQGALAMIHSMSFSDQSFPARSGWLSEQTEAQTSDVPIKLRVPNPKGLLRAGMTVRIELHEQAVEGLAIPEAAITVNEEGHRVVTIIREAKAIPTEIIISSEKEPEVRADGWVRVLSGLEAGDEVAIENGYALPKDTPVQVLPPAPAETAVLPEATPSH
jgi:HlyD family secretion protein